jgi:hypothetical protein
MKQRRKKNRSIQQKMEERNKKKKELENKKESRRKQREERSFEFFSCIQGSGLKFFEMKWGNQEQLTKMGIRNVR